MHKPHLQRHVSSLATATLITATTVTLGLCLPSTVLAHPGHGSTPADAPEHYLVEPWHAVPILLGVIVVTALVRLFRRRSQTQTVKSEQVDV